MRSHSFNLATKKSIILCFLFALFLGGWSQLFAQRSNSVYVELGGAGGHYSVNYERSFVQNDKISFYGSIGFSRSLLNGEAFSPRVPIQLKFGFPVSTGTELELGAGITPRWSTKKVSGRDPWIGSYYYEKTEFNIALSGRIGLRHQLGDKSFIGYYYTPVIENQYDGQGITHWAAVTVGFKF